MPDSGSALSCEPVVCQKAAPAGVSHASECALGTYGATCTASCDDPGYEAGGDREYTCDADGKWSGGHLQCTGRPCIGAPTASGDLIGPP
eukprot:COSAG01_NODE_27269_length_690_cov_0.774958_1_plen_89_part_01